MHNTILANSSHSGLRGVGRYAVALVGVISAAVGTSFGAANYVYHERSLGDVAGGNPSSCVGAQAYTSTLNPTTGQPVTVRCKVEYQLLTDRMKVYYTTDGSNPDGAQGVGNVGTLVLSGTYDCTFTQAGNTIDVASAIIPPQTAGTIVKYIISAYQSGGGDEIFANSGTCLECGNFTTAAQATVFSYTVGEAPSIVSEPSAQVVCSGATATLSVGAGGSAPLSYQWYLGESEVNGANMASLTIPNAQAGNAGNYSVVITNAYGAVTSSIAALTVNPLPFVTVNSETICAGGSATLTATTSAANPAYLWSPGGETTASITVSPAATTVYSVTVTDGVTTCAAGAIGTVTVRPIEIFANNAAVTINDAAAGSPYPSTINVSGLTAAVCKVTVTLNGLTHSFPSDIDLLLVAPNGQSVLLVSDAGNGTAVTGVDLILDDAAAASLPESATLVSGTFKPTNFGNKVDSFPAPAPAGPHGSTLSSLSGINPNGNWSLYAVDDESFDAGQLAGGWSLAISTLTPIADLAVSQSAIPQPVAVGSNLTITVTVANNGPSDAANVALTDTLPAGVGFLSASSSSGSCSESLGVVSCNLGTLLSGSAATVTLNLSAATAGAALNAASVTSSTTDLVAGNNSSSSPVSIIEPVNITLGLVNQAVCVGGGVMLTVAANGGAPFTYQWYHDAVLIPTATGATLALSGAQVADSGNYTVVVANAASASSSSAVLTVNALPTVAVNSETICLGSSATLMATTSAANPSYLWSPGGATTATITVSPTSTTIYSVTVTDGSTTCSASASGTVTILPLTTASALTSVTNLCPGLPASFTTTASGTGPFTYVWRKNGAALAETSATLSIASVVAADAGTYTVEVSGLCNTVTNSATLSVVLPPTITAQPQNQATPMGNGAVFTVAASSVVASNIQWQLNGVDIPGATGTSVTVSNVTLAQSGSAYRAVISNCGGTTTSLAAILTVTPQFGISFDFNTPNQYSNAPFNLKSNNWMSSAIINGLNNPYIPTVAFEVPTGGVGNGGALDLAFNQANAQSSTLHPVSFDFSLPGKTLVASAMVKVKAPANNNRNTQIGFTTATNLDLDNSAGRSYMTVILQSTAQPALTFDVRQGSKPSAANTFIEGNSSAAATLASAKWYKLTATFINSNAVQAGTYRVSGLLQDMGTDGLAAPTTVATMGPVTITNVDVTSAKNLFLVLRSIENAGADFHDNVYAYSTNGPAYFVQQPASQTIAQGRQIAFQAQVNGEGPYTYQWNKNGIAIPNAGSWNYTTPPMLLSDDGAQYTVTVTTPNGTITSDPATITVQSDELNVVSAGSVEGSTVGVRFDQPVDRASAEIAANYSINGTPVYAAQLRPNGTDVLLSPAAPISGTFTVTVANVVSLSGTSIGANNSAIGTVAGLTGYDVNPLSINFNGNVSTYPGENFSFGPGSFEVTGGGHDLFGNFDGFRFVYTTKTGDFDVKMRVPYQDLLRTPNKVGFDVRASLDASAPSVFAGVNPMAPGRNFSEGTVRPNYNVATVSWGNNTTCAYPNAWIRFRRVGNTFIRYSSTNGVNWLFDGQTSPTPAFPDTVYFGFAVCANVGTGNLQQMVRAEIDGYGDFAGYPGATITLLTSPTNITVASGTSVTLAATATVSGGGIPATAGELTYVWQRSNGAGGWTNLLTAGVTNNTTTTSTLIASDNGAQFRVIVSAPGAASVTSSIATVTVTDTAAPTISGFTLPNLSSYQLVVNFSEPMSPSSALNPANYTVTNSAGTDMGVASVTFLGGDPRVVVITTVNLLVPDTYGVRFGNVQDLGGNVVAANTVRTFRQQAVAPLAPIVTEIYTDLQNTPTDITALTGNIKYQNNSPDFIVYSNVFGINPLAAAFPDTLNNYGAKIYTYFVPTNTGIYKFYVRADDYAQFLMNTNATDSINPAGAVVQAFLTVNNQSYNPTNGANLAVATNFLNAGQRYYMELRFKETTGGDGGTVAIRTGTDTAVPGQGEVIPASLCTFPDGIAARTPVVAELYTGQVTVNSQALNNNGAAFGSGGLPDLTASTNTLNFIARVPNVIGYEKYFGFRTNLSQLQVSFDNYLGRMYSYFVAPSNGLYRFYIRGDDSQELWMNTNTVNSTDPAGIRLLGQVNDFYDVNYRLAGQNVSLIGGQRYYLEGRWREGTGGDGMTVAVRSQGDTAVPGQAEVIPGSMLEFPTNLARIGALSVRVTPINPTVQEGATINFVAENVSGTPPYTFVWFKNGVLVGNGVFYNTQPLTSADNGAVYTLMVTNALSTASAVSVVTVNTDTTVPTIVSAVASPYMESVTVTFSEPLNALTAGCLANYTISGLRVYGADFDEINRNRVILRTSPQSPNTGYMLTVSGVRDASAAGNVIAPGSSISFSGWGTGGFGAVYVEVFTNIPGTAVGLLQQDPKFIGNRPDVDYYTNIFAFGLVNGDSGLNNYGARLSGYYTPPSNGWYRFYLRSDDASQLFMNTNGASPSGRVMIGRNDGANPSAFDNGVGLGVTGANVSPVISLNTNTAYYIEGLLKEGGGGDHFEVALRAVDPTTLASIGGVPAVNTLAEFMTASGFTAPGNPDVNRLIVNQAPPAELFVAENDKTTLTVSATILPASLVRFAGYQWQRSAPASSDFSNIPGATASSYTFFPPLADDGTRYRVLVSIPGTNTSFTTLMHVVPDLQKPYFTAASSLDGNTIDVCFNERIEPPVLADNFNYLVNGGAVSVVLVSPRPDGLSAKLYLDLPVSGVFTVQADNMQDLATNPNIGSTATNGIVQGFSPFDVGAPPGAGSSFSCIPGEIDVFAGGADIWGTSDIGHLTLTPRTGDFDIWLRVKSVTRAAGDNDLISKAGLMVRETAAADSRKLQVLLEPPLPGAREFYEAGQRPTTGAATAAWAGGAATGFGPAGMPNGWARIKRVGDLFLAYRSLDGVNWTLATTNLLALPQTVLVGLGTTAHVPAPSASTVFAEFRDIHVPNPPRFLSQPAPVSQTDAVGALASITASVTNEPNSGALTLQWLKDGVVIPGANAETLTIASAQAGHSGIYTLRAGNDGGQTNSIAATLIVSNSLPVVTGESFAATQGLALTVSGASLLANDTDAEGAALNIIGVDGICSSPAFSGFEYGVPPGARIYGNAAVRSSGGVADSSLLRITDGIINQSGSIVFDDMGAGAPMAAFTASFKLRISDASAEPADGFSFNFAADLPDGVSGAAENGVGTGLSLCVDNYRFAPFPAGGTANTSGMKVRYGGVDIGGIQSPTWNSPDFVPVTVTLKVGGLLTVTVGSSNLVTDLPVPYVPAAGRFGLYARTGGQFQSHSVDDLVIRPTYLTPNGGLVTLNSGTGDVTYTPAAGYCGPDSYVYLVSDGQQGGVSCGLVSLMVREAIEIAPIITTCPANRTIAAGANCQAAIPSMLGELIVTDNCTYLVTSQSPAAGTLVGLGNTVVTFTATDSAGLTATCNATVTVADQTAPQITSCATPVVVPAGAACTGLVPDLTTMVVATDICGPVTVTQEPAAGTTIPTGITAVLLIATDAAGNTNLCSTTVNVVDATGPIITCPADITVSCSDTNGATVSFTATALDNCDINPIVTAVPASGSVFAVGTNIVAVTAVDAAGNTNICSFKVIVNDPVQPTLTISHVGSDVVIKWPQTCTQYILQETVDLNDPVTWTTTTGAITAVGADYQITLPASAGNKYFRLKKP